MQDFIGARARQEIFKLKPYIPGKPIDEVKRELGLDDIIKMASNENPLGPSPRALEAITKILPEIYLYPDANCYNLKQRLAAIYNMPETSILIGNGSDELLKLLAETFLNRGDQVIFAQPTFSEYEFVSLIMGAECIKVPLINFTHDLDAVLDAITPQTKIIFLCNPNNPTGTIVNALQMQDFMERVGDDILVVFDEAYCEYAESPAFSSGLDYVRAGHNAVVFRTFSKIYGLAALRVGYGFTTPAIAHAVERVMEPFNVNTLAQVGALAALDDQAHVQNSQQLNHQGKAYLYAELTRLGLQYIPTEANFIFFDCGMNCQTVFQGLLQQGVIVRTCDHFGYPECIRVTVGKPEDNQRFISSLEKVLRP